MTAQPPVRRQVDVIADAATDALEAITDRAVRRILEVARSYQDTGAVDVADLSRSVRTHIETVLCCLREDRLLDESEIDVRRGLGVRRAQQGMPVTDVMRAFRLGYVELWEELLAIAHRLGAAAESQLLQSASIVWTTLDQISSAVAEGHREATERAELDVRRLALAFVAGLRRYPAGLDDTARQARELGLSPDGPYLVAVFTGSALRPDGLVVEGAHSTVVIRQPAGDPASAELALAKELAASGLGHVGIGMTGSGIAGAAAGLGQAEGALALSLRGDNPVVFREEWLLCLVLGQLTDVQGVLGPAIDLLRTDDSLRQTLSAYVRSRGQLATAAAELFVHPNTVAYRIGRIAERTGIDARTGPGAPIAWLAMRLAELPADQV